MSKQNSFFGRGASVIAIALAAAGVAPLAMAQDAAPAVEPEEEIVVTGSHIRRNSFNAPTPVAVIGADRMEELGIPNVGDALNQLPSFRALTSPSTILFRVSGAIAGRSLDLRGLGTSRTLTLVDGRRFVPSTDNGTVDLNGIPSAMVERAEVVTGGASAAYGADAVAGVVNLILNTDFEGFKTDVSYGVSQEGDNESWTASIMGGADFADGRGHFIVGFEYQDEHGVGRCETRDYCKRYTNFVNNPGFNTNQALSNGLPAVLVLDNVLFVENPTGILVGARTAAGVTLGQQVNNTGANRLPTALQGKQFSADGQALAPFQFGNFLSGLFMQGGDPSVDQLYGFGNVPLVTPSSHISTMQHVDFELTPSISVFGEFMFSHVEGGPVRSQYFTPTPIGGTAGLSIDNPFVSTAVRAAVLAADPTITTLLVNVTKPETRDNVVATSANDIWRAAAGIRGEVFGDWTWDLSYTHGETKSETVIANTRLTPVDGANAASPFPYSAVDAITPPAGYTGTIYRTPAGAPVICRSSVTNPANGCIPINLVGANSISPEAYAKYWQSQYMDRAIVQDAFAANLRGSLFELPAGPVQAAIGAEYREDSAQGSADALVLSGAFSTPQATALPRVKTEVMEQYVEVSVPVLADMPLVQSLTVDGAYRFTHYSSSGDAETWKVGVVYEPSEQLLLRFTRSSDIRAPTPSELNPNAIVTNLPLNDPFGGGTHLIRTVTGGNPGLGNEEAETTTIGIVLKPSFLPNFNLSVDYYDINVDGAIDSLTPTAILTACRNNGSLCDLITFSGAPRNSPAAEVFSNFQNLSTLHAEGYEVVLDYKLEDVFGGEVNFSANANYVEDLTSINAVGVVTRLDGVTGNAGSLTNTLGVPSWKIDGVISYSQPEWTVTAHGRYIPESILDPLKIGAEQRGYNIALPNSVTENTVADVFYLDLSGTLRPNTELFGGKMEIYGAINNVTNQFPPKPLRFFGNPLHYDVVGRAFRLGLRTSW